MIRKLAFLVCASFSLSVFCSDFKPANVAYVEINHHPLAEVGCYLRSDTSEPFFNVAIILAATLHPANNKHPNPNHLVVSLSKKTMKVLDETNEVKMLQEKGIKVLLSLYGKNKKAGWSCMTDEKSILDFTNKIVDLIVHYNLDGIDIDDEYYTCTANETSMIRVAQAIKSNPKFKGKLLTKALYEDKRYFLSTYEKGENKYKLAELLDYGWEMDYEHRDYSGRLEPYKTYGMLPENLYLGVSTLMKVEEGAATFVKNNGYGGIMVYDVYNSPAIRNFLSNFSKIIYGTDLISNCGLINTKQK